MQTENQNSSFFAMLFRLKYINRWGLMRNFKTENVAEHSIETAFLTHALAEIGNTYFGMNYNSEKLALAAIYHDISEIFTGDMPSPIKYRSDDIKSVYKKIEADAVESMLAKLPPELAEKYAPYTSENIEGAHLIKAADKLSAYIKCVEETSSGNMDFARAKDELYKILDTSNINELQYFIKYFLPYFSRTVDEI